MEAGIVVPIVTEVISAGKGFLLKLTDSVEIAVYSGSKLATVILQEKVGQSNPWFGVVIPIHIANRSKVERCLLRYFKMEMIGLGDVYTPYDGDVTLIGDYRVSSFDFLQRETILSARILRSSSNKVKDKLEELRMEERNILESVLIDPQKIETILVEFRCPLGDSYPKKLKGGFKLNVYADVVFPSVVSKEEEKLLSFDHSFSIDLILNTIDISTLQKDKINNWDKISPLAQCLKKNI